MIIVDTNVVSEFMRKDPNPAVLAWSRTIPTRALFTTSITIEEIEFGIRTLPLGARRQSLETLWNTFRTSPTLKVCPYDVPAAEATAALMVNRRSAGNTIERADAQIAGICLSKQAQLATRNLKHFHGIPGLHVFDPFTHTS